MAIIIPISGKINQSEAGLSLQERRPDCDPQARIPTYQETQMIDSRTAPYAAFALRIALGAMFIAHALLKYSVFTLPGTVKFFESLGLPGPLAYVTFFAELIGGALILAGVYSRWVSAALIPILVGATW